MALLRFDGRVAVITGAGRGVGREYARLLGSRGAAVVVNDLGAASNGAGSSAEPAEQVAREILDAGGTAVADTHSVAEQPGAQALISAALEQFGRIDVLIHNAGFVNGTYDELVAVNLSAAHWLTEAVWPTMQEQRYGRILLTTSSSGLFGSGPMQSYGASKMGVFGLGKCLAVRGRACDIAVNLISPCAYTRLVSELTLTPRMQWVADNAPPELVAPAAAFLVHESCPVSGQAFAVGAGRVARIFVGETTGYVNRDMTVEDVAAHLGVILAEDGYHVPADMDELQDLYMKTASV
ncbi:MAG TPA: SDR family NAD(P)-dependent oxidoreductase [Sporichthyaceae bacterium]|jgi:NAD(P)-dependent dehydrogenase (short-subunit alcohol dehydrogenase family)|nr:SDR family NAD(P)-dependent oxidoreductase [Sporichthyaceae bacterium]